MMNLATFLIMASEAPIDKPIEQTFPDENSAVRFRLRLYREKSKKENAFLPQVTVLLRGNKLIAGPKGFDLMGQLDEETMKKMREIEARQDEELNKVFAAIEYEKDFSKRGKEDFQNALEAMKKGEKLNENEQRKRMGLKPIEEDLNEGAIDLYGSED